MRMIIVRVETVLILDINFTVSIPWTNVAIMSSACIADKSLKICQRCRLTMVLRFEKTDDDFRVPGGLAFERTNFGPRISGQNKLVSQQSSYRCFLRRGSGSNRSIKSHQIVPDTPGSSDAFVPWDEVRHNLPHLVWCPQIGGSVARFRFRLKIDDQLFSLDHTGCSKARVGRIRDGVSIVVHG